MNKPDIHNYGRISEYAEDLEEYCAGLERRNKLVKPVAIGYRHNCPICGHSLFCDENAQKPNYCMSCGQALDWSVEE